jgi:hypothetical protein
VHIAACLVDCVKQGVAAHLRKGLQGQNSSLDGWGRVGVVSMHGEELELSTHLYSQVPQRGGQLLAHEAEPTPMAIGLVVNHRSLASTPPCGRARG